VPPTSRVIEPQDASPSACVTVVTWASATESPTSQVQVAPEYEQMSPVPKGSQDAESHFSGELGQVADATPPPNA